MQRTENRPRPSSPAPPVAIAPLLAAAAAAIVFHRSTLYFFSQDDFMGLARASGLAPRLTGLWRFISQQGFYDLMRAVAGLEAWPYHLASLLAHAGCSALLAWLLARVLSPPAALVGAAFFAAHPALFTAVYWIAAIADSLALLCALAAIALALRDGRERWAALPLAALSFSSKESTLLLPAIAAVVARSPGVNRRLPPALLIGLAAIAALHLILFLAGHAGVRAGGPETAPYALALGPHVIENALTYLGWTANFLLFTVRGFSDAVDRQVFPWGIGLGVVWLAGLASRRLRERGWLAGGITFALFLLPVLPLRHHTYHYYLYAPVVGAAWCVAAAFDAFASPGLAPRTPRRSDRPRLAWSAAGALVALLTLNGAALVRKIETAPFVLPGMRADPVVDRARIARNVRDGLAAAHLPARASVRFWSPVAASLASGGAARPDSAARETYWERNVRGALLEGLAVKVLFPHIDSVRFVRGFEGGADAVWYALYLPDGRLRVVAAAEIDSLLRSSGR
jgi:hypothetical protein